MAKGYPRQKRKEDYGKIRDEAMRHKEYKTPFVKVDEAECSMMVAVSIIEGKNADPDSPVMTKENDDWNMWEE